MLDDLVEVLHDRWIPVAHDAENNHVATIGEGGRAGHRGGVNVKEGEPA